MEKVVSTDWALPKVAILEAAVSTAAEVPTAVAAVVVAVVVVVVVVAAVVVVVAVAVAMFLISNFKGSAKPMPLLEGMRATIPLKVGKVVVVMEVLAPCYLPKVSHRVEQGGHVDRAQARAARGVIRVIVTKSSYKEAVRGARSEKSQSQKALVVDRRTRRHVAHHRANTFLHPMPLRILQAVASHATAGKASASSFTASASTHSSFASGATVFHAKIRLPIRT